MLDTAAGLWLAVILAGVYHGVNPGMGWPLAVSAGLMERGLRPLLRALAALAAGHLIAMLAILLPFAFLTVLLDWQFEIRVGAGLILIALGLYLAATRRHPRFLARVPPTKLALWSFLVAMAHGAGLMLVPIYLGMNRMPEGHHDHGAAMALMTGNAGLSLLVALVHTLAMIGAGGAVAIGVYKWLGLKFLTQGWFDLDLVWALSLILVGGIGIVAAF